MKLLLTLALSVVAANLLTACCCCYPTNPNSFAADVSSGLMASQAEAVAEHVVAQANRPSESGEQKF